MRHHPTALPGLTMTKTDSASPRLDIGAGVSRARGTSFIEYALLCAIIVGGCAVVLVNLQGSVTTKLNAIANTLK